MAAKFIAIKNYEKYQKTNTKVGTRPWVKLWKSLLGDAEFMKLTPEYRFIYTGLILLADDCQNKIYADSTYLRQRLYITHTEGIHGTYIGHTELDLRPLYRAGFLSTTNLARVLSEKRREEKRRGEGEAHTHTLSQNGSLEHKIPAKIQRPLPEDWTPKDHHARFALAQQLNLKLEADHFRGRALELEWKTKDWDRKFSNWMLQEVKFRQR
jgi:hypothetical protein